MGKPAATERGMMPRDVPPVESRVLELRDHVDLPSVDVGPRHGGDGV